MAMDNYRFRLATWN